MCCQEEDCGWHPVNPPLDMLKQTMGELKSMAQDAGRAPAAIEVVVRANLMTTEQLLGKDRWTFTCTLGQIEEDVNAVLELGIDGLVFAPTFSSDSQSEEGFIRNLERIRQMV